MVEKNELFELAGSFVAYTRANIFLTGRAGTGKTTFLKHIRQAANKRSAVLAPTGIAALNAGGMTIHSFFQLPLGSYVPDSLAGFISSSIQVNDKHTLLKHARYNSARKTLIRELELLIIDEVSMLRADILDALDTMLRYVRRQDAPFGGVQLLFIGDLYQLPPVVNQEEWKILGRYYQSPFFFDVWVLKENPPVYIELQKIYRQSDEVFIRLLNSVRNNCIGHDEMDLLHERYDPAFKPPDDREKPWITLTTHNNRADAINHDALKSLPGRMYSLEGKVFGDFGDRQLPAERNLQLKVGAQVMFIRNDTGEDRRFYNGKLGEVVSIDENEERVYVKCPGEKEPVEVERNEWKNIRYTYNEKENKIDEEQLGSYNQYPLRLAWAVTIHKSQGLTFERAIVDAGSSFTAGQVYVALSRLTTIEGLVLRTRIARNCILTDMKVQDFSSLQRGLDELQEKLSSEQAVFVEQTTIEAFSLFTMLEKLEENHNSYEDRKIAGLDEAVSWSAEMLQKMQDILKVSDKFVGQLKNILSSGPANYPLLQERVKAAAAYFNDRLEADIITPLNKHISDYSVKKRTKKYISDLQSLLQYLVNKKQNITQAMFLADGLANGRDIGQTLRESRNLAAKPVERPVKADTRSLSYSLYQDGLSLAQIAAKRELTEGTISGHLLDRLVTGEIPVSYFVTKEKADAISDCVRSIENPGINEIRKRLGEDFTYSEIKAVLVHLGLNTTKVPTY